MKKNITSDCGYGDIVLEDFFSVGCNQHTRIETAHENEIVKSGKYPTNKKRLIGKK